jgi:para-nitrobenzyl esterase
MAQALNAPSTGAIAYLRSLPASKITGAMAAVRAGMAKMNYNSYDEGIDGYTVPENPPDVYRTHKELPIPLMIGHTARDSGVVNAADPKADFSPSSGHVLNKVPANDEEAAAWARSALETYYGQYPDLLDKALKAYGVGSPAKENVHYPPYGTLAQQIGSDINHRCGTRVTANWHSTIAPTWEWEFSRSIPEPAHHGSELAYVFGTLSKEQLADPNAVKVRDQIQTYWTNFARTGDPNGAGVPEWPKFDAKQPQSIEFRDNGAVARTASRAIACAPYIEKFNRDPHPMLSGENRAIRPGNLGGTYD